MGGTGHESGRGLLAGRLEREVASRVALAEKYQRLLARCEAAETALATTSTRGADGADDDAPVSHVANGNAPSRADSGGDGVPRR